MFLLCFYTLNKDIIITIFIELEHHVKKILKLKRGFSYIKETGSASVCTNKYTLISALKIFTFKFIRVPVHIALPIFTLNLSECYYIKYIQLILLLIPF